MSTQNFNQSATALIVEDNVDLANVYSIALNEAGFQTETLYDGAVAMSKLAIDTPDLVILDLGLPNVPGEDILSYIRSEDRLAHTRVIITSADQRLATMLGGSGVIVLVKPVSFKQLRELSARLKSLI
ncbi:MAG: DNA-binding response OmpR family regulator [Cellvibrionaceae bacterium]|jgi:DNA-binding response OmpR family regulator